MAVRRRPMVYKKPRPVSMVVVDTRRRKPTFVSDTEISKRRSMHFGTGPGQEVSDQWRRSGSSPLIHRPKVQVQASASLAGSSCFQRRWDFSRSLREKRISSAVNSTVNNRASFRTISTNKNQNFSPFRSTKTLPRSFQISNAGGELVPHKRTSILPFWRVRQLLLFDVIFDLNLDFYPRDTCILRFWWILDSDSYHLFGFLGCKQARCSCSLNNFG